MKKIKIEGKTLQTDHASQLPKENSQGWEEKK